MDQKSSEQTIARSCECGIAFKDVNKEDLLQKITHNSEGDKHPCVKCVHRLIDSDPSDQSYCFICEITFPGRKFLYNHILMRHIPSKPYKCENCEEKFGIASFLDIHKNTCKGKLASICKKKLASTCKGKLASTCKEKLVSICKGKLVSNLSAKYYSEYLPRSRAGEFRLPESFICHLCGKGFNRHQWFKNHLESHDDVKHRCEYCEKVFLTKLRVVNHIRRTHKKKAPEGQVQVKVECDICKQIVSKSGLRKHKIRKHGNRGEKEALKKHQCNYCTLRFTGASELSDHVNSKHTGEKPYVCETCGKSFGNRLSFKRHQVIHTGVKKFKCDTCGASFNQKCTLTRHQVVHTGEKPFECGICGQRFTQKPYMMAHKKKHKEGEVVAKKQKKKKNKQESSEESEEDMSEESEEDMSEESEEDMSEEAEDSDENDEMSAENSDE